ncbi:hypothetical protein JCM10207_004824 [Rhodosporidiobolus poonsookiae]
MATSTGSPITQVDEPVASTSLADAFSAPPAPEEAPVASPNSPNPGAKPVRPPKAAQRPSTASQRKEGAEGSFAGAAAAGSAADNSDGATTVPATSAGQGAVEGDASTNEATAAPATTAAGVAVPNGVTEASQRSSTAAPSLSTSEQTGESSTSKGASTTSPSTTASPAQPKTASSTPPAPAPTSRAAPAPAASTSKPRSVKKRKGPLSFLFACLPCVSDPGVDDTAPGGSLPKRPSTAARIAKDEKEKATTSDSSKVNEKAPTPVEPESALTPPTQEPLLAASPDTPAGPPPPTAGHSQQGVVLPQEETEGVTSGAVVPPGQAGPQHPPTPGAGPTKTKRRKSGKTPTGTDGIITSVPEPGARAGGIVLGGAGETSDESGSDEDDEDEDDEEEEEDEEQSLIARGGVGIPIGPDGQPMPLLEALSDDLKGRKCLVLDLDETLVHSSFKLVHQADYVVPVEIENQFHNVYVIKRPGVDGFLKAMGEIYEVVVFTASLSKYADPVLDQLDVHRVVKHRLFRESCYNNKGNYVKDLSQLGRPMEECIIIDNSPASYVFHPNNAVPISSWFNDPHDTELTDLVPFLADLGSVDDVRAVLDANLYQQVAPVPGGGGGDELLAGTGFTQ